MSGGSTVHRLSMRRDADDDNDHFSTLRNVDAEQALLGAILLNNKIFEHVADVVAAEDFSLELHARLFRSITAYLECGLHADHILLYGEYELDPALAGLGGARYLARLVEGVVTIINAPDYACQIADLARRRDLVSAANDLISDAAAVTPERDAAAIIDEAEQRFYDLAHRAQASGHKGPVGMREAVDGVVEQISDSHRNGGIMLLASGLQRLDEIIDGFGPGDLNVLAGRPAMGKSALAGTIAMNLARKGKRSLIFSLEMSRAELVQRWLAGISGISTAAMRTGQLDMEHWAALAEAQQIIRSLPIVIDDQPRLSVAQMRQRARRIRRRGGLDHIIIDHLQLVRQGGKQESRRLEIGDATSALKALAKELGVPILLLSQLNRSVETRDEKRPVLADLRESGDIEQDADVVMFLFREEYYLARGEPRHKPGEAPAVFEGRRADWEERMTRVRGLAEIDVAKNRHGRTGAARVAWLPDRQRFENLITVGDFR